MKFIFTADLHIRSTTPRCRTDWFEASMWEKVKFLSELSEKHKAPIIVAGDIFHEWKSSPWLINKCLKKLPKMYVIAGNHDLPNHSLKQVKKSALITLIISKRLVKLDYEKPKKFKNILVYGFHYGMEPVNTDREPGKIKIAVIHRLVTSTKDQIWRNTSADEAPSLVKNLTGYDIIITGDNHKTFTCRHNNTLLINPGSFTRQTSAQMEHEPCVFLHNTKTGKTKKIILPHDKEAVSEKHLEVSRQRDERMAKFINKLDDSYEIGLSYINNVESYFEHHKESKRVKTMVWESIEYNTGNEEEEDEQPE